MPKLMARRENPQNVLFPAPASQGSLALASALGRELVGAFACPGSVPMASFAFRSEATARALLADLPWELAAFPRASSVWQLLLEAAGQEEAKLLSPRGAVGSSLRCRLSSPREHYFPKASVEVRHPGYPCFDCTQHQEAPGL